MAGEPTETDLAYVAGLFNGEGNINMAKARAKSGATRYTLHIRITNSDLPLIEDVHSLLGGVISRRSRTSLTRRPLYDVIWCSTSAQEILKLLLPYLKSIKRREAVIAIGFQDLVDDKASHNTPLTQLELEVREILYRRSRDLKKPVNTREGE